MDKIKFGRNLFAARKAQKITAVQLAEQTGISASFIRQVECGKRSPSLGLLITLCNELGVSSDYLLSGDLSANRLTQVQQIEAKIRSLPPGRLDMLENLVDVLERDTTNVQN